MKQGSKFNQEIFNPRVKRNGNQFHRQDITLGLSSSRQNLYPNVFPTGLGISPLTEYSNISKSVRRLGSTNESCSWEHQSRILLISILTSLYRFHVAAQFAKFLKILTIHSYLEIL